MQFTINDIDDYQERLTEEQKEILVQHSNKYNIKPVICAWYENNDDFEDDWCGDLGYTEEEAADLLNGKNNNAGEFLIFDNETIIRLEM